MLGLTERNLATAQLQLDRATVSTSAGIGGALPVNR
jgi:hypothetical protein